MVALQELSVSILVYKEHQYRYMYFIARIDSSKKYGF